MTVQEFRQRAPNTSTRMSDEEIADFIDRLETFWSDCFAIQRRQREREREQKEAVTA